MSQAIIYEVTFFFFLGYLGIIFEKFLRANKAAIALTMAGGCWLIFFSQLQGDVTPSTFAAIVSNVAQIVFFLLGAMVIVELIDSHHGFKVITDILYTTSKRKMLWFLIGISFFMSAILDNLTSMIVMISLLRKMIEDQKERWLLGSIIVISVNAGGAWTPIGDVTTTMLWINGKITSWQTIKSLFLPSVTCVVVSGLLATFLLKKDKREDTGEVRHLPMEPGAKYVLMIGLAALIMIPVWKSVFHLPPFMGALIGLGLLWLVTDLMHFRHGESRWHLRVTHILTKIDTSGAFFFIGILFAIGALEMSGALKELALFLEKHVPNQNYIAVLIGLISSVVDNVPLVAATMGMYSTEQFPIDSSLWQLIAYAAGTGGSILIIGSAAGVAFMGLEKIDFVWYFLRISWIALIGYFAGLGVYFMFL